jgi:hypothetical protein
MPTLRRHVSHTLLVAALGLALAPAAVADCPADTDGNGRVNVDDLVNIIVGWGTDGQGTPGVNADVDDSGLVDVNDLVEIIVAFGPCPVDVPECTDTNSPHMTISYDGLASYVPYIGPPASSGLTWGLTTLNNDGFVIMHSDAQLWASLDDGCTWTAIGTTDPFGLYRIARASDTSAYAWFENGSGSGPKAGIYFIRNSPAGSDTFLVTFRPAPVPAMHGFGVDPANPAHARTANNAGLIYETFNAGATWAPIGVAASPGGGFLSYVIEFDPSDLDHAVFGRSSAGSFVTFDGGASWTQATGLMSTKDHGTNFFSAAISPVDGNHVFAMAIDLGETFNPNEPPPPPSQGRHLYLSTDGGLTYTPVLSQGTGGGEPGEGIFVQNQPVIRASRTDANVFHYLFSVSPAFGGTTVYRYEVGVPGWTSIHSESISKLRIFDESGVHPGAWLLGFGS